MTDIKRPNKRKHRLRRRGTKQANREYDVTPYPGSLCDMAKPFARKNAQGEWEEIPPDER